MKIIFPMDLGLIIILEKIILDYLQGKRAKILDQIWDLFKELG